MLSTGDRYIGYFSAYKRVRRQSGQTYGTGVRISSALILLRNPSSVDGETIDSSPTASVPCNSICSSGSLQSGQVFSEGISVGSTVASRKTNSMWSLIRIELTVLMAINSQSSVTGCFRREHVWRIGFQQSPPFIFDVAHSHHWEPLVFVTKI